MTDYTVGNERLFTDVVKQLTADLQLEWYSFDNEVDNFTMYHANHKTESIRQMFNIFVWKDSKVVSFRHIITLVGYDKNIADYRIKLVR